MASTVPAKSQPLHNFNLPHLKWNKDGHSGGNHQRRRSVKSPSRRPNSSSASPLRQSPRRDSVSATPPRLQSPLSDSAAPSPRESPIRGDYLGKQSPVHEWVKHSPRRDLTSESEASGRSRGGLIEQRRNNSRNLTIDGVMSDVYSTKSERVKEKFESKSKAREVDLAGNKRSKFLIKIPCKNNKPEEENPQDEPPEIEHHSKDHHETDEVQEEGKINNNIDEETKTWNLRPRKPIRKSLNVNGGSVKNNGLTMSGTNKAPSPFRNPNHGSGKVEGNCGGGEKKRKLSIFVALTKEEIEEDIFALTGSKPKGRPRKTAKNVQKQMDFVFPGLCLVSINADSYKVSENSLKG
ncbi:hypothetical protein BUALT_Bualt19G0021900 [Buddleja alternifolia]|uniref:Uncharacterized protein n=1 Tax=Buddleja alternifolia TaxID=168488 RepID=A0AAV6VZM5_9LAMI|nr:hypothetical protein BUALT_Bualt19G0021900 [Buddleja alternifolia]